jgi:ribosomal protein L7/L12
MNNKQTWMIIHYIYMIGQYEDYIKCIRAIRFLTGLPLRDVKTLVDEIGSAESLWKWKSQLE